MQGAFINSPVAGFVPGTFAPFSLRNSNSDDSLDSVLFPAATALGVEMLAVGGAPADENDNGTSGVGGAGAVAAAGRGGDCIAGDADEVDIWGFERLKSSAAGV